MSVNCDVIVIFLIYGQFGAYINSILLSHNAINRTKNL